MMNGNMMGNGMMNGAGYGYLGFGGLIQVLFVLLFFLIVWWMVRSGGGFGFKSGSNETADDILKKRLARGEIDSKEYKRLKKEIEE